MAARCVIWILWSSSMPCCSVMRAMLFSRASRCPSSSFFFFSAASAPAGHPAELWRPSHHQGSSVVQQCTQQIQGATDPRDDPFSKPLPQADFPSSAQAVPLCSAAVAFTGYATKRKPQPSHQNCASNRYLAVLSGATSPFYCNKKGRRLCL